MKWLLRAVVALVVLYGVLFSAVALAMMQPPDRFGLFMRYMPAPVVWGALPARRMWLWARHGALEVGDEAPDFTLAFVDHSRRVSLASHRGERPVVLVFGSYT
jgi:hypothetical protein